MVWKEESSGGWRGCRGRKGVVWKGIQIGVYA